MTHDILPVSKINWETVPFKEPNDPDEDWVYPKKDDDEYYVLLPTKSDGFVKVMKIKPPEFVKKFCVIEGPFKTKKKVKKILDELNIPDHQRPLEFRNNKKSLDWSYE